MPWQPLGGERNLGAPGGEAGGWGPSPTPVHLQHWVGCGRLHMLQPKQGAWHPADSLGIQCEKVTSGVYQGHLHARTLVQRARPTKLCAGKHADPMGDMPVSLGTPGLQSGGPTGTLTPVACVHAVPRDPAPGQRPQQAGPVGS